MKERAQESPGAKAYTKLNRKYALNKMLADGPLKIDKRLKDKLMVYNKNKQRYFHDQKAAESQMQPEVQALRKGRNEYRDALDDYPLQSDDQSKTVESQHDRGDPIMSLYELKAPSSKVIESRNRESTMNTASHQSQDSFNTIDRQGKYQNTLNKQSYYSTPHIIPIK